MTSKCKRSGLIQTVASIALASAFALTAVPSYASIVFGFGPAPSSAGPALGSDNFNEMPATSNFQPMLHEQGGVAWLYVYPDAGTYTDPTPYWWTSAGSDIGFLPKGDQLLYNNGGGSPKSFTGVFVSPLLFMTGFQVDLAGGYALGPSTLDMHVTVSDGSGFDLHGLNLLLPDNLQTINVYETDPTKSIVSATFHCAGFVGGADGCMIDNWADFGHRLDGAVPEPSTWALMIIGFGLIGSTLRRRRTVTA